MISNISGLVFPPVLIGRHATVMALVAEMRKTERLPLDQIQAGQNLQLKYLLTHHSNKTPHFQDRLTAQNLKIQDIFSLKDLKKLTPIKKHDIQSAGSKFMCEEIPESHKPIGSVSTSGSTGQPITFNRTDINQLFWAAHVFRDHEWNGRKWEYKMASIRATLNGYAIIDNWGDPVGRFYKTGKGMAANVGETIEFHLDKLREFQPDILMAHGGVLQGLATSWERTGYDLDLKHIRNIGDNCHDELRKRLKVLTGLDVEDSYSSSETGCIAIQCPEQHKFHIMSETVIVEILDENGNECAPGEVGRVVLTDLQNFASPVIRYDIGDYAEQGSACTCGRTLPTLHKIIGRERNLFIRPDGTRFWPRAGMYDIPKIAPVRQWQMVQHSIDHVEYRLVVDTPLTEEQREQIKALVPKFLLFNPQVTVTEFPDAIPTKNGKYEETICLVQ